MRSSNVGRSSVKDRLGGGGSDRLRGRLGNSHNRNGNNSDVLDREQLENLRPDVKPWDIDPEFVPKGRNYFEHDNRENDEEEDDGFGRGGWGGRGRGGWRGRGRGGWRGRGDRFDNGWRGGRGGGSWRGGGHNRGGKNYQEYDQQISYFKYA